MARHKDYKYFDLQNIKDVDLLIEYIKTHGNFTQKQFNILLRASANSSQPQRIRMKLMHQVKPLISQDVLKNNVETGINSLQSEPQDFFMRTHKASEFTLKDGYMQIGQYVLKSKRIQNVHPSWLKDIDHEFYIVRDYLFKDRFYFDPPTDLSYMLNAIQEQKIQQERDINREQFYKQLEKKIEKYFYDYINTSLLYNPCQIPYNKKRLCEFLEVESPTYFYTDSEIKDFLCVPLKSVKVEDGKIEINFKYIDIISPRKKDYHYPDHKYLSSSGFIDYLRFYLYDDEYIKEFEEEITQYYNKGMVKILDGLKVKSKVTIKTFITSKSFHTIFKGLRFLTFSCDREFSIHWSIFNYIDYYKFTQEIIAEKVILKKETKTWFTSVRNKYKSILQKEKYELEYKELGIKECLSEDLFYNPLFKAKEFCYIKKFNSRLALCDEKTHHVLFFHENMAHCSDDWTHYSPGHTTFIVWPKYKVKNVIELYPTNKNLSNYKFYIDTNKIDQEKASFLLYRFFSSNIQNKRQGFSLDYYIFLKEAGIIRFKRM